METLICCLEIVLRALGAQRRGFATPCIQARVWVGCMKDKDVLEQTPAPASSGRPPAWFEKFNNAATYLALSEPMMTHVWPTHAFVYSCTGAFARRTQTYVSAHMCIQMICMVRTRRTHSIRQPPQVAKLDYHKKLSMHTNPESAPTLCMFNWPHQNAILSRPSIPSHPKSSLGGSHYAVEISQNAPLSKISLLGFQNASAMLIFALPSPRIRAGGSGTSCGLSKVVQG